MIIIISTFIGFIIGIFCMFWYIGKKFDIFKFP